jgi:hypothetical protein
MRDWARLDARTVDAGYLNLRKGEPKLPTLYYVGSYVGSYVGTYVGAVVLRMQKWY